MISKARVIEHFGSVAEAAKFFGVKYQAVFQWDEDGQGIPRERELELMLRLPAVFGAPIPEKKKAEA